MNYTHVKSCSNASGRLADDGIDYQHCVMAMGKKKPAAGAG